MPPSASTVYKKNAGLALIIFGDCDSNCIIFLITVKFDDCDPNVIILLITAKFDDCYADSHFAAGRVSPAVCENGLN